MENESNAEFIREELFHENMSVMFNDINKEFINNRIKEKLELDESLSNVDIKLVHISDMHLYTNYDYGLLNKYITNGIRNLCFEFSGLSSLDERFILDKYYMKFELSYTKENLSVCRADINMNGKKDFFGYLDSPFNTIEYSIKQLLDRQGEYLVESIKSSVIDEFENKKIFNKCLSMCNDKENKLLFNLLNKLADNIEYDGQQECQYKDIIEFIEGN